MDNENLNLNKNGDRGVADEKGRELALGSSDDAQFDSDPFSGDDAVKSEVEPRQSGSDGHADGDAPSDADGHVGGNPYSGGSEIEPYTKEDKSPSNPYSKNGGKYVVKKVPDKTNKIVRTIIYIAVAFVVAVVSFVGGYMASGSVRDEARSLNFLLDVYNQYYYDPVDGSKTQIVADILLDKYSEYYTADELAELLQSDSGEHKGIGVSFNGLQIFSVVGNSPADHAGVRAGGVVTHYRESGDNEYIEAHSIDEVIAALNTYESEKIDFKIDYNGVIKQYSLERKNYNESYVRFFDSTGQYVFWENSSNTAMELVSADGYNNYVIPSDTAVIEFSGFLGTKNDTYGSVNQFYTALQKCVGKNVIIDLRNNGGGYVNIMSEIASMLCPADGKFLTMYALDKNGSKQEFYSEGKYSYPDGGFKSITFLANINSASASEALIGCVHDYNSLNGGTQVNVVLEKTTLSSGTVYRSYGKGIMQSMYPNYLTGEAVKLTTATIYWPLSGNCIHDVGITSALGAWVINGSNDVMLDAINLH